MVHDQTIDEEFEVDVDFNPELFNNVYWHLKNAFDNLLIRFIWLYGGSSASKTFSVVQLQIVRMMERKNENALVMRKYMVDIKDSIYADFEGIIKDWGLEDYFVIQQNYIRCISTGSYVRFRGLDDSEKIKGISRFKRIILDEISQFDETDLKQIRKRLRGMDGQQIVGIFNPISEDHWIKMNVFDKEDLNFVDSDITGMWVNTSGNLVVMKTNYLDNRYIVGPNRIDQHVIDDFEKDKITDDAYYQVYGLGNWGRIRTGSEFWKDFNANTHIFNPLWREELPIWISWDENVNPYLTCLVWQIYREPDGYMWAEQIDEICLPDPNNRVQNVCTEFIKRYPQQRVKGLFVGGDRTSIKEDTKLEKGENFYTKILQYLQTYSPTLRMQSVNPSIVQSAGFINQIYAGAIDGLGIRIGRNCTKSINDYQYAVEDSDGTLKKSKVTNKVTKVSYEEYGHPSDAKRYFMTMAFADKYTEYLRGGRKHHIKIGKPVSKNNNY